MKYEVRFSRRAERYLRRLDARMQERILLRIDQILTDPFDRETSKPLENTSGMRSARVGDYRIVFDVDASVRLVRVGSIGPRGQVYRDI